MEDPKLYISISLIILPLIILIIKFLTQTNKTSSNHPPSPPSLPYIGHLHLLKHPIHRTLQKLAQKHGPIISLKFGPQHVTLVSSSYYAEECFTKHDIIFANRPYFALGKHLAYNFNTMVTAPYGEHYINLRKISLLELLSMKRLNMSVNIRRDEVVKMVKNILPPLHYTRPIDGTREKVGKCSKYNGTEEVYEYLNLISYNNAKVELSSMFRVFVFNSLLRMLTGKVYYGEDVVDFEEAKRVTDIIREILECAGASYPGDFLAVYKWVDYDGYIKRIKGLAVKTDEFLQGLVDEHRKGVCDKNGEESMISRLLFLQKSDPDYYTDETIKGLILVLIVAGTDTTSTTMEWIMSLLLNHPNVMDKVKSEIDIQVGQDHLFDELDLPKVPYLQNVIFEAQRLYPAVPLLLPHLSSQECQIGGFDIPRGTMLLVNAWAIHRDPKIWDEPEVFKPERFETSNVDQCRFLPSGSGRRSCPGAALGNRMVALAIGSLIQCFDWRRIGEEEIDMNEGRGLNMPKAQPLEALCKALPITNKIL